jgi:hypothetical protein
MMQNNKHGFLFFGLIITAILACGGVGGNDVAEIEDQPVNNVETEPESTVSNEPTPATINKPDNLKESIFVGRGGGGGFGC